MTEKRFKHHMGLICEKKDGEYYSFTVKEVCDLLNVLHEENEQLKHDASVLVQANKEYRVENEKLKKEIEKLHEQIFSHSIEFKSLCNNYRTLKLQNKELKERLENVLSELYCKDRKLEENGISIECCDKNNQK